jgi:radical SAM superfamily enzyme YgiQ (UPF0313 family)
MRGAAVGLSVLLLRLPVPSFQRCSFSYVTTITLAPGYLKAYAHRLGYTGKADIEIFDPLNNDFACDLRILSLIRDKKPDILGLSLCVWNVDRSLHIAREARKLLPGLKVIAGGPEVSPNSPWILGEEAIDVFVFGEGEGPFCDLLGCFLEGSPGLGQIPGIGFRTDDGELVMTGPRAPLPDFGDIPSPYLLGFIKPSNYRQMWLESVRGCPRGCIYCVERSRYSEASPEKIMERISRELKLARDSHVQSIDLLDSSFNFSPVADRVLDLLKKSNRDRQFRYYISIHPDTITHRMAQRITSDFVVDCGLQSINPEALRLMKRHVRLDDLKKRLRWLKAQGAEIRVHLILGLAGDTRETMFHTLDYMRETHVPPWTIVFLLSMFPGSNLWMERKKLKYRFQSRPPYLVLGTPLLSFEDIRAGVEKSASHKFSNAYTLYHRDIGLPFLLTHASSQEGPVPISRADARYESYPCNKIIIHGGAPAEMLLERGIRLADGVTGTLCIWMKTGDLEEDLPGFMAFLHGLSEPNPHNLYNLVIETPRPFSLNLLDNMREGIRSQRNYLDYASVYFQEHLVEERTRQAERFHILVDAPAAFPPSWLNDAETKGDVFFSMTLGEGKPLPLDDARADWKVLVDFIYPISIEFALNSLRKLKELYSAEKIYFRNWVFQREWRADAFEKADFLSIGDLEPVEEKMATVGPDGSTRITTITRESLARVYLEWATAKRGYLLSHPRAIYA